MRLKRIHGLPIIMITTLNSKKTFLLKRKQHLAGGGRWIGDSASLDRSEADFNYTCVEDGVRTRLTDKLNANKNAATSRCRVLPVSKLKGPTCLHTRSRIP